MGYSGPMLTLLLLACTDPVAPPPLEPAPNAAVAPPLGSSPPPPGAPPPAATAPTEGGGLPTALLPDGTLPPLTTAPALLPEVKALQGEVGKVRLAGPEAAQPIGKSVNAVTEKLGLVVEAVSAEGSKESLAAVKKGTADCAVLGRALRPDESDYVATTIGYDGVALIAGRDNAIKGLTTAQIKGIFGGTITSWAEVGGAADTVNVYRRPDGKTATKLFEEHFGLAGTVVTSATIVDNEKELATTVGGDKDAIGYVSLAGLRAQGLEGVKLLAIDGVQPIVSEITAQRYALVRPISIVTKGAPTGATKTFVEFLTSKTGQAVVALTYAPVR